VFSMVVTCISCITYLWWIWRWIINPYLNLR
jgi:hypothetical protein